MAAPKSPYGKSKHPRRFSSLEEFRDEIVERRKTLVPTKSHLNLTAKALDKIEQGSDLRPPMVAKYLTLIGHRATVALKRGTAPVREVALEKLSEASILAVKADSMANRDVARQLGKNQDYFSLKDSSPSLEFALEIFAFLGYDPKLRLYSEGITEEMSNNLELKRSKLGLRCRKEESSRTVQQLEAQSALDALLGGS